MLIGYSGPLIFSLFLALVLFLSQLEFNRMGLATEAVCEQWLAAGVACLVVPVFHTSRFDLLLPVYTFSFLLLALLFLFRLRDIGAIQKQFGWLSLGLLYLPLLLGHLVLLRQLADGRGWIFMTLMAIMGCDTLAYFVGSNVGRRKLYPAVSPNKSVEGGIGGLCGAVIAVWIAGMTFLPQLGFLDALLIGLLLGFAGQLGDLFESLLKRSCGVKDSGAIIPGHGGLLDRLDSLLFAFPIVYYLARWGYGG